MGEKRGGDWGRGGGYVFFSPFSDHSWSKYATFSEKLIFLTLLISSLPLFLLIEYFFTRLTPMKRLNGEFRKFVELNTDNKGIGTEEKDNNATID